MKLHRAPLLLLLAAACSKGDDAPRADAPPAQAPPPGTAAGALPPVPPAVAVTPDSVRALVPVGTVRVSLMDLVPPPRLNELNARVQAALSSDPAWWAEYNRTNQQPGKPLPYHPKMGVTEAEYREMVALVEGVRLSPVRQAELTVRDEGNGRFVMNGGTALPELTGVVVDLANNRVDTPFGSTLTSAPIAPDARKQQATGPWKGMSWTREELQPQTRTGTVISFTLGRLQQSGRGILYYEAGRVQGGKPMGRVSRVLTYDLPRG